MKKLTQKLYRGTDPIKDASILYREAAKKKMKLDQIITGNDNSKLDPLDTYGPGVQAYFRLIEFLIMTFVILSILMIPVIVIYHNGQGYDEDS
jgi:hypothetical protein